MTREIISFSFLICWGEFCRWTLLFWNARAKDDTRWDRWGMMRWFEVSIAEQWNTMELMTLHIFTLWFQRIEKSVALSAFFRICPRVMIRGKAWGCVGWWLSPSAKYLKMIQRWSMNIMKLCYSKKNDIWLIFKWRTQWTPHVFEVSPA